MIFASKRDRRILLHEAAADCYGIHQIPEGRLDTIIDIGANVGLIALTAKLKHPKAAIHCFEPCREVHAMLKKNVAHMGIHAYNAALGDGNPVMMLRGNSSVGSSTIPFVESSSESSTSSVSSESEIIIPEKIRQQPIPSFTFPDMVERFKLPIDKRTLIKIDCEGAETTLMNDECGELLMRAGIVGFEIHRDVWAYLDWLMRTFHWDFSFSVSVHKMANVIMWDKKEYKDVFK